MTNIISKSLTYNDIPKVLGNTQDRIKELTQHLEANPSIDILNQLLVIHTEANASDDTDKSAIFKDIPRIQFLAGNDESTLDRLEQMLYKYTLSNNKPSFLQGKFEGRFFEGIFNTVISLLEAQENADQANDNPSAHIEAIKKNCLTYSYINHNNKLCSITLYYHPDSEVQANQNHIKLKGFTLIHTQDCLSKDASIDIFEHAADDFTTVIDYVSHPKNNKSENIADNQQVFEQIKLLLPEHFHQQLKLEDNMFTLERNFEALKSPEALTIRDWENNYAIFHQLIKDVPDAWSYLQDNKLLQQSVIALEKHQLLNKDSFLQIRENEAIQQKINQTTKRQKLELLLIQDHFAQLSAKLITNNQQELNQAYKTLYNKLCSSIEQPLVFDDQTCYRNPDESLRLLRGLNHVISTLNDREKTAADKISVLNDYENDAKQSPYFSNIYADIVKFLTTATLMIAGSIIGTIVGGIPGTIVGAALGLSIGIALNKPIDKLTIFKSENSKMLDDIITRASDIAK
ncbi:MULTISPECIES: hypothetical protein [Cysteiniphilum]|uniref:hypothetical protein n=1 Tax=Cysteiniphilum TaxID=2056696 RepID=UPI001782F697|nr:MULTISPECIES: hypothetical protein [Cysteiniphilum]